VACSLLVLAGGLSLLLALVLGFVFVFSFLFFFLGAVLFFACFGGLRLSAQILTVENASGHGYPLSGLRFTNRTGLCSQATGPDVLLQACPLRAEGSRPTPRNV